MEYCVCGHFRINHKSRPHMPEGFCICIVDLCKCEKFQLNNLRFIEELAKEQGLV